MTDVTFDSTVLDEVHGFVSEILYASPAKLDAFTLALAVSHACDAFTAVPRVMFRGRSAQSGKTTALDIAKLLAGNPLDGSGTTPGLSSAYINNDGKPALSVVKDEIHHIFGRNGLGGQSHPLYDPFLRGYRNNATHLFSSGHNANLVSIYGMCFLAGLGNAVPSDLLSRCIVIDMDPKPGSMMLRNSGADDTIVLGEAYSKSLHRWARANQNFVKEFARNTPGHRIHPKLVNRKAEIWIGLFGIAAAAGGDWPVRCLMAFEELALDESDRPVLTPREQALLDMADVFRANKGAKHLPVKTLFDGLLTMPHAGEVYDGLTSKGLVDLMHRAADCDSTPKWDSGQGKTVRVRFRDDIVPAANALIKAKYPEPEVTSDDPEQWEIELGLADDPKANADGLKRSRAATPKAEVPVPSESVSEPVSADSAQDRLNKLMGR